MKRHALVFVTIAALSGGPAAGQCVIDPNTGIRSCCMNCGDPSPAQGERNESGGREPRHSNPAREASSPPAIEKIGRDMKRERALLRRLVVRAESLPVGAATMTTGIVPVPAGRAYFGAASVSPAVELRVPLGYTAPSSIPIENLRRAAAIVRAVRAQLPTVSSEDLRFYAEQAGKALEGGGPLQVVVPDVRVADVAARRREADAWVAKLEAAGKQLDELQTRRDAIERRLAPLKRQYDAGSAARSAAHVALEKKYRDLLEQERNAQGQLRQTAAQLTKTLVEVEP